VNYKKQIVAGKSKPVVSPTSVKMDKAQLGNNYLCMDLNYDKKLPEKVVSPQVCRKVYMTGVDIINDPTTTKFGSLGTKPPQPSSLPRGKPLFLYFGVCNMGNIVMANTNTKLKARFLISKDAKPSPDDLVLLQSTSSQKSLKAYKPNTGKGHCGWMHDSSKALTIPTSVKAGYYHLIFHLNYDGSMLEPLGNNIRTVPVKLL